MSKISYLSDEKIQQDIVIFRIDGKSHNLFDYSNNTLYI